MVQKFQVDVEKMMKKHKPCVYTLKDHNPGEIFEKGAHFFGTSRTN